MSEPQSALTEKKGIPDLAAAYVKAWGEIDNVVKNAANPHFGSNYADLGAVLDTVRPIFSGHGLAIMTAPGEMAGDQMTLTWMLIHTTGQFVSGKMSLPIGSKATAQAGGSCLTYMRRYLSASIGGIAQVDDDGNAASAGEPRGAKPAAKKAAPQGGTYADTKAELEKKIADASSTPELEALKGEIAEIGDQELANAYVARKKALKGAK